MASTIRHWPSGTGGSGRFARRRLFRENLERQESRHDEIGHVDRFAEPQIGCHGANRVGLLTRPSALYQHVYHMKQGVTRGERRVLGFVDAVADAKSDGGDKALRRGEFGRSEIVIALETGELDIATLRLALAQ